VAPLGEARTGADVGPTAVEELDVVVIGAGLSGICAGHHLQTAAPWASYAILEGRNAMGGTWDLFRYPGVRSDSDMFTLGFPFKPWTSDRMIVDGASIKRYIEQTAADEGIDKRVRFGHRVSSASWDSAEGRWRIYADTPDGPVEFRSRFLFSCTGYYNYERGHRPAFNGEERFTGTIVHPQHWPSELDYQGKRVVVIGSGATAVTLVPAMADDAASVTMLQRSPTYVASVPARNPVVGVLQRFVPARTAATATRWAHALGTQGMYVFSRRHPKLVRAVLQQMVKRQLPSGYAVDPHFTPHYDPWDERMCAVPGGDLFKAIAAGRAEVVTDQIDSFTETGILLQSGGELKADVVVTATGLELLFIGGIELTVDGEPIDVAGRLTYKGMMLEGLPNFAFAIGYTNASWTLKCDLSAAYVARLLNHMRTTERWMCTPRNDDATLESKPILEMRSGYIARAAGLMPAQGSRFPWQVHQSFLRDYRAMRLGGIEDGAMHFEPVGSSTRASRRIDAA
jgi:cation diffusion facilitator CzcD-associated flavoprotein CzcO